MRAPARPVSIEDVEPASPAPREIVVAVRASGVCHSDLSALRGHVGLEAPAILGHEVAGEVIAVGDQVGSLGLGDRVIGSFVPVCGVCRWCVGHQTHLCAMSAEVRAAVRARTHDGEDVRAMLGLGAFAQQITIDERQAVMVASDLPYEQLALISCAIATGAGAALFTAGVEPGSTVAVLGCGGVGQAVIQGARIAGARKIIAVDPLPSKLAVAKQNGATHLVDPSAASTAEQIRDLTGGLGVDHAFEVVGQPSTVVAAYESARRGGAVVTVGIPAPSARIELSAPDFFRAEKSLISSYYGSTQVRSGFQLFADLIASGQFDADSLITHRYRLDDVATALDDLDAGRSVRGVIIQD